MYFVVYIVPTAISADFFFKSRNWKENPAVLFRTIL